MAIAISMALFSQLARVLEHGHALGALDDADGPRQLGVLAGDGDLAGEPLRRQGLDAPPAVPSFGARTASILFWFAVSACSHSFCASEGCQSLTNWSITI